MLCGAWDTAKHFSIQKGGWRGGGVEGVVDWTSLCCGATEVHCVCGNWTSRRVDLSSETKQAVPPSPSPLVPANPPPPEPNNNSTSFVSQAFVYPEKFFLPSFAQPPPPKFLFSLSIVFHRSHYPPHPPPSPTQRKKKGFSTKLQRTTQTLARARRTTSFSASALCALINHPTILLCLRITAR